MVLRMVGLLLLLIAVALLFGAKAARGVLAVICVSFAMLAALMVGIVFWFDYVIAPRPLDTTATSVPACRQHWSAETGSMVYHGDCAQ